MIGRAGIRWSPEVTRPEFTFELAAHILAFDLPDQVPSIEDVLDGRWAESGACRGAPVGVFYPTTGGRGTGDDARAICASCPVRAHCLVWAIQTDEPAGIWAGFDEDERRHLMRRTRRQFLTIVQGPDR